METYVTAARVARMFRVSIPTVRRYISSGELPAAKVGRRYVIAGDDIDRFVSARREAGTSDEAGKREGSRRRQGVRAGRRS